MRKLSSDLFAELKLLKTSPDEQAQQL